MSGVIFFIPCGNGVIKHEVALVCGMLLGCGYELGTLHVKVVLILEIFFFRYVDG